MTRCAAAAAVAVAVAFLAAAASASAAGVGTCARRDAPPFLDAIGSRCPFIRIEPSPPIEVSGEAVDTELNLRRKGASYSILFYASWCPFSSKFRPIFEALSTMYPQIQHFAVEESSATPRCFPAVGLDPIAHLDIVLQEGTGSLTPIMSWDQSLRQMTKDEPFLLLAVLFIILKVAAYFVPAVLSHLRAFLVVRVQNMNLGIRRGSNQLLDRALNVLDVRRLWSKLRLSNKATDLRKGASNARAWASSFTSVSLGESSSSRQA
nr:unnamed protein product [Digitaria exilis]